MRPERPEADPFRNSAGWDIFVTDADAQTEAPVTLARVYLSWNRGKQ